MEQFINTKENKLEIPVNEIDNIYIWTQVSNTQEILLSSKKYFQLITRSFREEVKPVLNVLNDKIPSIKESSYTFADYLSFKLNNHVIFNKSTCFCYMTNTNLLNSLICYIAHTKNKFNIEEDSIASLIINKIDEPDRFTSLLDKDFVILRDYAHLPDHKYRSAILDSILLRRSVPNKITLILLANKGILIANNLIPEERARDKKLSRLDGLLEKFNLRRTSTYQSLLSEWFSLMPINLEKFIYSKEQPKETVRKIMKKNNR